MSGVHYRAVARQPRLADQVAEQMRAWLADAGLRPGDRLPTERELAGAYGVSRTVVREALRALSAEGLVDLPGGRGAVVAAPRTKGPHEALGRLRRLAEDPRPERKLLEVRRLIEAEAAELAATRASVEAAQALEAAVGRMQSAATPVEAAEAEVDFHAALARATGNELFNVLFDSLSEAMLEMRQAALARPAARVAAVGDHQRILDRIRAGDEAGARQAMLAHLTEPGEASAAA